MKALQEQRGSSGTFQFIEYTNRPKPEHTTQSDETKFMFFQ